MLPHAHAMVDEPHGGFTKSDKPVMPVISEGPYGYWHVNAAEQRRNSNSLLDWTKHIIRMRKEVPGDRLRTPQGAEHPRQCHPRPALRLAQQFGAVPAQSCGRAARDEVHDRAARRRRTFADQPVEHGAQRGRRRRQACVCLEAYGYRWYRVGGLDYLLKRTESDACVPPSSRLRASIARCVIPLPALQRHQPSSARSVSSEIVPVRSRWVDTRTTAPASGTAMPCASGPKLSATSIRSPRKLRS